MFKVKSFFNLLLATAFFFSGFASKTLAQTCPTAAATVVQVCEDAGGSSVIRLIFNDGTPPYNFGPGNPYTYILFDLIGPTPVSDPFGPVTITLIAPNIIEFGNVPNGDYIARVSRTPPGCFVNIGGFGINVNSANALSATATLTPDCGSSNGEILITPSGGTAPYTYNWSGPVVIPNTEDNPTGLPAGTYAVTIVDADNCSFTIDPINLPITTVANAGADQTVCNSSALLAGNAAGPGETGTWTVISGAGSFSNANDNAATVSGLNAGVNIFEWSITDNAAVCPGTSDQVTITRNLPPTADAGLDQTICAGGTVNLAGSIGGSASSATWSGGAGTFVPNNTTLNAVYTPSAGEVTAGTVTLTLTTDDPDGAGPCVPAIDQVVITINAAATVNAGPDQTICAGSTVNLAGSIGGSASSATWSGGAGTFVPNNTTLNALYTPSAGEVTAGTLTLTLTTNDPDGAGPCLPAVDQVTIIINAAATVNAGPDQTICAGNTVNLAGSIGGSASSATWSGGAGSFVPNNATLNAVYAPSAGEVTAGTVTLTLTTNDPDGAGPCLPAVDQVVITINAAATVNAGPDQTICAGNTVNLAGSIGGSASSATWSGGAGTFAPNNTTLNAVYTPSAGEVTAGTVTLTLTTNDPDGAGPCVAVSDQLTITINAAATVNAGPDQTICAGGTVNLAGSIGGSASSATWSGGGGSFVPNNATLNAVYTPSAAEVTAGTVTLTLTTNDPDGAGPCLPAVDQVTITINAAATVNAGPDQAICAGSTVTLAGSIGGSATSATWSGGTGTFAPNNTTLNAVYTPSAGEVTAGTVTLTLTTNDPDGAGPCVAVSDQLTITINAIATVNAGPDQTICAGSTVNLAGSIGGSASSATWSGGGGSFVPNNATLNAVYTPSAGEVAAGTVTLTLTTNDPDGAGPCLPAVDQVTITINAAATVNAGPDQAICAGSTVTLAGSIGGSATSATWSGGTGTFAPDNTTLNAVYTPSAGEVTAGTVTLTLTTNDPDGAGPCLPAVDQVVITVNAVATVNAGPDQTICAGSTVPLAGSIGGSAVNATWSGGGGTFAPDNTTLNAVYTPSAAEVTAGTVTLTLTTNDPDGAGPCLAAVDQVVITINAAATVNAGPDQTICGGNTVNLAGSIGGSASSATWSGGGGTFAPDNTTLNAVYTPSAGEVTAGTVTLTLTTNDPDGAGPCLPAVDQITITINAVATVNAGPDQTICASGTSTLAGSIGGSASSATWSGGAGTFAPNNTTLNAVYTPSAGEVTAGTVTLTLTTNDPDGAGPCVAVSDQLTITIQTPVSGALSGNASICIGQSASLTVTFTGPGPTWDFVYSDGSSTFNGTAGTNPFSFSVSPLISTNYSLVSVTDASCGAGTVSGTATVTVNPIPGNPATFGNETWIGYVYDDSSSPFPPASDINFSGAKYRGFIDENDIDNMTALSSYEVASDTFDLNLGTASIFGPNVCGSYAEDFSIRYRMRKTFAAGVYTFTVGADDGVRLFVDGVNVITNPLAFFIHSYTEFTSAPICLTAGQHDLVIEYFERGTDARVSFTYALVPAPTLNPVSPLDVCVNTATPTLGVSSPDPLVVDFNWYTDAALTNLVFTGANYTPAPAELDITVVASSDFFVTAVYGGGCESPANTMLVNVVSSASLTLPPTTVCETGGIIDLTTLVTATPTGGAFIFAGTGVSGNNFDPSGLSGLVPINVDYTVASCTSNGTLNITVANSATITVPGSTVQACESAGTIDLTTLVSGSPGGGAFTFSGPQVTGSTFDPAGLSGAQTILVDYSSGGCVAPQAQFDINVSSTATLTITNSNVCQDAGIVSLLAFVSATPAGGTFTFTGTGVSGTTFNPAGLTGPINISVTYTGVCSAAGTLTLTVLDPSNPLCGGGGVNCGAFVITPITVVPPTCADQDNGQLVFDVDLFGGGDSNYRFTLERINITNPADSLTRSLIGPGPFDLSPLGAGDYQYTIVDLINGDVCGPAGNVFTVSLQTTVQATADPSSFVDATCNGQPTGSAVINATGSTTGQYFYSLTGSADPAEWFMFVPGNAITTLPPNGTYIVLVGESAPDVCRDSVSVTINNLNGPITANLTAMPATCNNNDGAISIDAPLPAGGAGGPYTYQFGLAGSEVPVSLPPGNVFSNLAAGTYNFIVSDNLGCQQVFTRQVTFPGFVNTSAISITPPDCPSNGTNGSIALIITDIGSYEFALTTDPMFVPTAGDYTSTGGLVLIIPNLSNGNYFVWLRSLGAQCATKLGPLAVQGVSAVSFTAASSNEICFGDGGSIVLSNITGAPNVDFTYTLVLSGVPTVNPITFLESLAPVTIPNLSPGNYLVRLNQDQTALNGCVVNTAFQPFTIIGPNASLDTLAVENIVESFPDQPTGSMLVVIDESGAEPYELKVELTQPFLPGQLFLRDFTVVVRNPTNLRMEDQLNELYPGIYELTLRDALGCEVVREVEIPVDTDIFIPNIFTPNNDGFNDIFYVRNLPPSGANLIISNRWGKEVYSSSSYQNNWSGGSESDGVYYYRLQASGQTFIGWVEILRGSKP